MKKLASILLVFCVATGLWADVHISVGDPESWSTQQLSSYLGQTVIFDCPIVVCSNAGGNYRVGPWRMFQPQNQGVMGSKEYNLATHINGSCTFTLSGISGYHRCGEKIYNLKATVNSTSSLTFVSGTWNGNTRADLEAALPDLGDYRLLVCGFNLENYFVEHIGSQYLGPDTYAEHQTQRKKVSNALKKINADVFGLVELEQGNAAIQEIVSDLNQNLPGRNYQFFSDASSGTSQKSDFVYDANKVEPIGLPVEINTEIALRKRMICFREKETGEKFIYSINHFKAMNTGDEYRRVNEATAVVDYYKKYYQNPSVRDKDVLFMGDLNCYAKTEPVFVFTNNGMIDLHRAFHADSSYSYMFGGLASYIDHALCNETMYGQITGMSAYHINSDEDDRYTYDGKWSDNTMFRCSDHDPVLVGLKLDSTLVYDPSPRINSADIQSGEGGLLVIRNAHKEGQKSFYAIYNISGLLLDRQEIMSAYYEVELPQQTGVYIVYVYFDGQAKQMKMIVR